MRKSDVIVIGSGAAGLAAAASAANAGASVLVVTKGMAGRSGATATVSGDINVDGATARDLLGMRRADRADSMDDYFADTVMAGKYLNDQGLVTAMVERIGQEVKSLMDDGLRVGGPIRTPGHRRARGVTTSGMDLMQVQLKRLRRLNVKFREEFYVTDVITEADGAAGVFGIDLRSGNVAAVRARAVIIATGGGMMAYPVQTAPEELTGDGHAMALAAGAELVDMEMVQFLPCCLATPPAWRGLQFPWLIGPQSRVQAWLLNRLGERFMERWDPVNKETATRDIIAIACATEVLEGRGSPHGGVYLSWAHLPTNLIDHLQDWCAKPHLKRGWKWEGFDFSALIDQIKSGKALEVASASHFFMGGVAIGVDGATRVPGLFACGEAGGGANGANRLSGNACTQILVQGAIAGQAAARYAQASAWIDVGHRQVIDMEASLLAPFGREKGIAPHEFKARVQEVANRSVGIIRDADSLAYAVNLMPSLHADLGSLSCRSKDRRYNREWVEAIECRSSLAVLESIVVSALHRRESRGAHYRTDFPDRDDRQYLANGYLSRGPAGGLRHEFRPARLERLKPAATEGRA